MAGEEQQQTNNPAGPADPRPGVLLAAVVSSYLEESLSKSYRLHRLYKAPEPAPDRAAWLHRIHPEVRAVVGTAAAAASEELIQQLPNLELVACYSVGTDQVHFPSCKRRGIAVTNTPDVLTDDCADLALALLLACTRRIVPADRHVRQGLWEAQGEFPLSSKVGGKRVGLVGLGRIGFAVASRAVAFGCRISYYSRARKAEADAQGFEYFPDVESLARACDVVVLCCALTPDTRGLVGRSVLDALGPHGTLVNIARGPVVQEEELVLALQEGRIGAAGLDVYEDEPRVPRELWGMDNVVLLPHVASATVETRRAMADLVLDNLAAHFAGRPLITPVQF